MLSEIRIGPSTSTDGPVNPARGGRTGALIAADAHGRYWEACSRGEVFVAANTGAQATSTASATATRLILTNPVNSGKVFEIIDVTVGVGAVVAAAFEVGMFAGFYSATAVTHTTPITPRCALIGMTTLPTGLVDSAATLPVAPTHIRTLLASGWVTATAQSQEVAKDEIAGAIGLLPGCSLSIQSVVGTQSCITSITWREQPLAVAS